MSGIQIGVTISGVTKFIAGQWKLKVSRKITCKWLLINLAAFFVKNLWSKLRTVPILIPNFWNLGTFEILTFWGPIGTWWLVATDTKIMQFQVPVFYQNRTKTPGFSIIKSKMLAIRSTIGKPNQLSNHVSDFWIPTVY